MPSTIQIVDETDETTVLFDLNDPTGAANPNSLKTTFALGGGFGLGNPPTEIDYFASESFPGGRVLHLRDPLTEMFFREYIEATTIDDLMAGVGELGKLIARGGLMKWLPQGATETRFIEFLPSPRPALFRGQESELWQAIQRVAMPQGLDLRLTRQPYLRTARLLSTVNKIEGNASMLVIDRDGTGRPDGRTWAPDATGISGELIDAANEAYRFAIATTSTKNLQYTTADSTFASGNVVTYSFYVKASAAGVVRARAVVQFQTNAGANVGAENVGTQTAIGTVWTRVTVTTTAAGATTGQALLSIRFENSAATSTTVYLRRDQAEVASAVTAFRPGDYDLSNDPTTVGKGMLVPLFAQGEAPTPAKLEVIMGAGANTLAARYSARWNTGVIGHRSICDLLNRHHFRAADATISVAPKSVTDSEAIGGSAIGPNYRRQHDTANGNSAAPSVSWPAATLTGSTLFLMIYVDAAGTTVTITPPGAWGAAIQTLDSATSGQLRVYKLEDAATRSGAEAFTLSAARAWWCAVVELQACGAVDRLIATTDSASGTASFSTGTTATTQQTDEYLLAFFAQAGTPTLSDPSNGFTRFDDTTTDVSVTLAERIVTATGTFESSSTATPADVGVAGIITVRIKNEVGIFQRLFRWEITTKLDSLRGLMDAYLRLKPQQRDEWDLQLRSVGSTGAAVFTGEIIRRSWKDPAAPNDYVLLPLGAASVPEDLDLAGVSLEVWGRRVSTQIANSDVKMPPFLYDSLILAPTDDAAVLIAQASDDEETWLGKDLNTPVTSPAGGTAGVDSGSELLLDTTSDNAGAASNNGSFFADGFHRFDFYLRNTGNADATALIRVRNVTDGTDAATLTVTVPFAAPGTALGTLLVDLDPAKRYQPQVDDPSANVYVQKIARRYSPTLAANERLVGDPVAEDDAPLVYAADSSGNYLRDGETQGPTPDFLGPGLTAAFVTLLDPEPSGFADHEHVLARTATLRHSHSPRFPG